MADEGVLLHDGNVFAGEDLSNTAALQGPNGSGQFLATKVSTAADYTILGQRSANARVYGVLQNKPKSGEAADVGYDGVSKAVYGGTVTRGDYLTTDSSGRLVTATTGQLACGVARVSGVIGDIGSVALFGANATVIAP